MTWISGALKADHWRNCGDLAWRQHTNRFSFDNVPMQSHAPSFVIQLQENNISTHRTYTSQSMCLQDPFSIFCKHLRYHLRRPCLGKACFSILVFHARSSQYAWVFLWSHLKKGAFQSYTCTFRNMRRSLTPRKLLQRSYKKNCPLMMQAAQTDLEPSPAKKPPKPQDKCVEKGMGNYVSVGIHLCASRSQI